MDLASVIISAALVAAVVLVAWLFSRLLRWARSGRGKAHAFGEVLTEVTQSAVVREAKQGKKSNDGGGGDPANAE